VSTPAQAGAITAWRNDAIGDVFDRTRIAELHAVEEERFADTHAGSRREHEQASASLLGGVPMSWMGSWPGGHPIAVAHAQGAHLTDVDGNEYVDVCLGDTGAMAGHGPAPTVAALAAQGARGITTMLPTEDGRWVGEELARRFGVPLWQFLLSATDANRNALRIARGITGRPKILAFDRVYHGTVDETLAWIDPVSGAVAERSTNLGSPVDPARTTKLVPFNDVDALERALAPGDVACVLTEPVLSGHGFVDPDPGFHDALRDVTRRTGTLLIVDETHMVCAGPGGCTALQGLEPDLLTAGKVLAGGIPLGVLGMTEETAARLHAVAQGPIMGVAGLGGTLAANALSLAAARATLSEVLTAEAYGHMDALGRTVVRDVEAVIAREGLPWHVRSYGARVEYAFRERPSRNGAEAFATRDAQLERFIHLYSLNRGVLVCPFHNLAMLSPATTHEDVARHAEVFAAAVAAATGSAAA
jgi:glutamate-1-semialdehyde 2,1-aminomutase